MLSIVAAPQRSRLNDRWFLVHSKPKSEAKAEFHLRSQGFTTFLPRFLKTVRHARQLKTVKAPLFPRYLFVSLCLESGPWLSICSTVGVSYLVSNRNGRPIPVPIGVVELLLARSNADLVQLDLDLVRGQRIRVLSGPFADLVGTLDWLDENGRVRVLLDLMANALPISMHRAAIAPAA